jgi:branched-chain amino acid transport system permease protein
LCAGLLLMLGACAPDERPRLALCERVLGVLEAGREPRLLEAVLPEGLPDTVVLRYRAEDVAGEQHLTCRFAPRRAGGGLVLEGVRTDREGELSATALFFLREHGLAGTPAVPPAEAGAARSGGLGPLPYFLQQLVNALAPCAIYALLATGYALIYGITGRINLAFGEFTTVGAFAALNGIVLAAARLAAALPLASLAGLVLALLAGVGLGVVLFGLVFAPLRQRGSQALLIATVGLAIAIGEALRLLAGSRQQWLEPFLDRPLTLLESGGGEVTSSAGQLVLAGLAVATVGAVVLMLRRSAFGRAYRACADDPEAAALLGVDTGRTLRRACMLGSVVAAVAGLVVAVRYGIVGFGMGTLWGFKALAAAVVGGIGSVPGAALGGVLIGLLEGLWAGYLPGAYREAALFVLLALMLGLRPHGLFGEAAGAGENPGMWRGRPGG